MMKFIFFLFVLGPFLMFAQKDSLSSDLDAAASEMLENAEKNIAIGIKNFSDLPRNNQGVRVMFYNTENLFYPEDDSTKRDDDFTVEGMKRWSYYRYDSHAMLPSEKKIYRLNGKAGRPRKGKA